MKRAIEWLGVVALGAVVGAGIVVLTCGFLIVIGARP